MGVSPTQLKLDGDVLGISSDDPAKFQLETLSEQRAALPSLHRRNLAQFKI
jgi:hypothetical protein